MLQGGCSESASAKLCSRSSPASTHSRPCTVIWNQRAPQRQSTSKDSLSFHRMEISQMERNKLITQVSFPTSAFILRSSLEPLVAGSLLSQTCKAFFSSCHVLRCALNYSCSFLSAVRYNFKHPSDWSSNVLIHSLDLNTVFLSYISCSLHSLRNTWVFVSACYIA